MIPPPVPIYEHADLRALFAAVCLCAIEEAKDPDPVKSLDAVLWLTGTDFPFWVEAAGVPLADPFELLISGRASRARTRKRGSPAVWRLTHE